MIINEVHKPVLLNEVLEYLKPVPGGTYIDATLNGGGHALEIVKHIQPEGVVLGIEWDSALIKETELRIMNYEFRKSLILVNDSYVNLKQIVQEYKIIPDGILFDLGLSSWHYEESGRGFSFKRNEPLDMRFNTAIGVPASEIVNLYTVPETGQTECRLNNEESVRLTIFVGAEK
jgi:16S rRNA (cytosine1402-N4)-methyltransferase